MKYLVRVILVALVVALFPGAAAAKNPEKPFAIQIVFAGTEESFWLQPTEEPKSLLLPSGRKIKGFAVADAATIVEKVYAGRNAFELAGLDPDVVLMKTLGLGADDNLVPESKERGGASEEGILCLDVATADGQVMRTLTINLPHKPFQAMYQIPDGGVEQFQRFTIPSALAIILSLRKNGLDSPSILGGVFGLRFVPSSSNPTASTETAIMRKDGDPLTPGCGECKNGKMVEEECVQGSPKTCQKCLVCG